MCNLPWSRPRCNCNCNDKQKNIVICCFLFLISITPFGFISALGESLVVQNVGSVVILAFWHLFSFSFTWLYVSLYILGVATKINKCKAGLLGFAALEFSNLVSALILLLKCYNKSSVCYHDDGIFNYAIGLPIVTTYFSFITAPVFVIFLLKKFKEAAIRDMNNINVIDPDSINSNNSDNNINNNVNIQINNYVGDTSASLVPTTEIPISIPMTIIKDDITKTINKKYGSTCAMCFEEIDHKILILPCEHYFHEQCLMPYIQYMSTIATKPVIKCPNCRFVITENVLVNINIASAENTLDASSSEVMTL